MNIGKALAVSAVAGMLMGTVACGGSQPAAQTGGAGGDPAATSGGDGSGEKKSCSGDKKSCSGDKKSCSGSAAPASSAK